MIFVDTGAWFSCFVPNDPDHQLAKDWLAENRHSLVTTDYVFDELVTLLLARGEVQRTAFAAKQIIEQQGCALVFVTKSDFLESWNTFQQFSDKCWSFTDCTSRVVMRRLNVSTAFALDEHFRQFATVTVVP